jgi:hypothetical protein
MKRRDFLVHSAGLGSVLVPLLGRAATPCPVSELRVEGGSSALTECQQSGPGTAPEWFVAMPNKTWIEVAAGSGRSDLQSWQRGSRLADVDPGSGAWSSAPFSAILTDFTGGSVDQDKGELIVGNAGGHASRQGNDMYACRIRSETPGWVRLSNPSSRAGTTGAVDSALSDNTPKAPHGWSRAVWGNGRVWWPTMDAYWPDNTTADCWSFNRASLGNPGQPVEATSGVWARHGKILSRAPDNSGLKFAGAGSTYDKVAKKVWTFANYDVYGQNAFAIDATYNGTNIMGDGAVRAYDAHPTENLVFGGMWIVCAWDLRVIIAMTATDSYTRPSTICVLDLNNPAAGFVYKGSTGSVDTSSGRGAVYHKASRSILLWDEGFGANVKRLSVPVAPLTSASSEWVWSSVAPASSNRVQPSSASENAGTYGKFNIIEDMGNGQGALVLINRITEAVYVYKLPAGSLA